jgi:hypothetical protein
LHYRTLLYLSPSPSLCNILSYPPNVYTTKIAAKARPNPTSSNLLISHLPRLLLPPRTRAKEILDPLPTPQEKPGTRKHDHKIKNTKRPKDPIIHPPIAIVNIEPPCEFITSRVLAEFAQAITAVLDVAACCGDEGLGVGLACLARRWREAREFGGGADDGAAVDGGAQEAVEEVAEGGEVVHP